jgi:hypothetical protein
MHFREFLFNLPQKEKDGGWGLETFSFLKRMDPILLTIPKAHLVYKWEKMLLTFALYNPQSLIFAAMT